MNSKELQVWFPSASLKCELLVLSNSGEARGPPWQSQPLWASVVAFILLPSSPSSVRSRELIGSTWFHPISVFLLLPLLLSPHPHYHPTLLLHIKKLQDFPCIDSISCVQLSSEAPLHPLSSGFLCSSRKTDPSSINFSSRPRCSRFPRTVAVAVISVV